MSAIDLTSFGIAVGHAGDDAGATGLTVIRGVDRPLRAGVAVFGRATGSRELATASPDHLVNGRIDAILLTGGSAYGLDAAAGVMRWMEERGRGFAVRAGVIPIVPAAVIYDLTPLGAFSARPTPDMAYAAAGRAVRRDIEEGSVGAGAGATVGKIHGPMMSMKGGLGCAVESLANGELSVVAIAVVNAFGDVRDAQGQIIAGARSVDGGFVDTLEELKRAQAAPSAKFDDLPLQNTTICAVAVNVPQTSAQLTQIARASGAALFRRITPCGTSIDGDTIFALAPDDAADNRAAEGKRFEPMLVESLAVSALEKAIERAVRLARGRDGVPGLADGH